MRRLMALMLFVLCGLALQAQTTLWQYNGPSPIIQEPLVHTNGTVYFATQDGMLRSLKASGVANWAIKPGGVVVTPLTYQNGMIFLGNSAQEIRAYGLDGHLIWKHSLGLNASTLIAVSGDGYLFVGTSDGYMHALSAASGAEVWKYKAGTQVGPPSIGHDGTVYFAGDNWVHAMNPQTQHVIWRQNFFNFSRVPIVLDTYDNLYYVRAGLFDMYDFHGNFIGELVDETGEPYLVENFQCLLYGDWLIVVAAGGGDVAGLNLVTGEAWAFNDANSGHAISVTSKMAVDDQGTITASSSGEMLWFSATTGELYTWQPSNGLGGAVTLMGMDTGWYLPTSDLKGLVVLRSGPNTQSLLGYAVPAGPAFGPWSQRGGTPYHQMRRDDPPDLWMTSPVDGTVITGAFSAQAQASDDFQLQNMSCYLNNTRMYKTPGGYLAWGADSGLFEDGEYLVSVIARDSGGNRAIAQSSVLFINPPPVYGVSSGPPIFSWLTNGVDNKYQVNVSMDANFTSILATSSTDTQEFRKSTSWQPSVKKWKKVTDAAILSPTIQTTFYWRVVGKSGGQVVRRTFILDKTR